MSPKQNISKKIEITRQELHTLAIENKFDFQSEDIQKLSMKLDNLINKYMLYEKREQKKHAFFFD